jgi:uncharacterized protein YcbX
MSSIRRVAAIRVYPFKSGRGLAVSSVEVDSVGLAADRRWMAVDGDGRFLSQRTHPRMALLSPSLRPDVMELRAPGMRPLLLQREEPALERLTLLRVWHTDRYAVDCGDASAAWISAFIGAPARIVRAVRPPERALQSEDGGVRAGFADASPALVVSAASLKDLNRRLDRPVPMDRFRPNVVLEGFEPFEEDVWGTRSLGSVPTRGGRPCPRCATTLVDQATAHRGVEPLRTLATFRRNATGEVEFGVNIFFDGVGTVRVGDPVTTPDPRGSTRDSGETVVLNDRPG